MKPFDKARFQNAFEQPPEPFRHAVSQALNSLPKPRGIILPRRAALLLTTLIMLFAAVGFALAPTWRMADFLHVDLKPLAVTVTHDFDLQGTMDKMDVTVREALYDGIMLKVTVAFTLKDETQGALLYYYDMYRYHGGDAPDGINLKDFQTAETSGRLYWLWVPSLICRDTGGQAHYLSPSSVPLYESAATVVVMFDVDMRGADAYTLPPAAKAVAYPDPLEIAFEPQLYQCESNPEFEKSIRGGYGFQSPECFFDLADKAKLSVTLSRTALPAQKYRIVNFPERFYELKTSAAFVTETPLAYYIRFSFDRTDACTYPDYSYYVEALDQDGQIFPPYTTMRTLYGDTGAIRSEAVVFKRDGRTLSGIRVTPHWDEEKNGPITLTLDLAPAE